MMLKQIKLEKTIILVSVCFFALSINFECMASDIIKKIKDTILYQEGTVEAVYYPRWINNDEFCYLKISYTGRTIDLGKGKAPIDFDKDISDLTLYVYRSNINEFAKEQLIKKLEIKSSLATLSDGALADLRLGSFKFLRDTSQIAFYIPNFPKDKMQGYVYYIMDADGNNMKVYNLDDIKALKDISPDGKFIVYSGVRDGKETLLIRDVIDNSSKEIYIKKTQGEFIDFLNWYFKDKIIISQTMSIYKESGWDEKYNLLFFNIEDKNTGLIYSEKLPKYKLVEELPTEAKGIAISPDEKTIILGGVCILREIDNQWKRTGKMDLTCPDFSPDGKIVIGLDKNNKIKIIETSKLLK